MKIIAADGLTIPRDIPKVLYKYRSWQENESLSEEKKFHKLLITQSVIYFNSVRNFNDPFDSVIPVRYDKLTTKEKYNLLQNSVRSKYPDAHKKEISKIVREKWDTGQLLDLNYLERCNQESVRSFCEIHGVFSTAMSPDNILMWSHYGNCHKGYCIGFNALELLNCISYQNQKSGFGLGLFPVEYSNRYPVLKPTYEKEKAFENSLNRLLRKSKLWAYEKEYRYILTGGVEKAYIIDNKIFKEIIFGCKISKFVKDEISEILNKRYPHIKKIQAKEKSNQFGIDLIEE